MKAAKNSRVLVLGISLALLTLSAAFAQEAPEEGVQEDFFDNEALDGLDGGDPYGGYGGYGDYGGDFMDGYGGEEEEMNPGDHIRGFIELDDITFDKFVPSAGPALIEFYAPWCGHCKHLANELAILGTVLGEHKRINLVKVNADEYRELAERFNIEGYPTIKYVDEEGNVEDVEGRTLEELAEFVWDKVGKVTYLPELEQHIKDFMEEEGEAERQALADKAKEVVSTLKTKTEQKYGEIYLKIMKSIIKKGDEYLGKEKTRIEKMIQKEQNSLTEDTVKSFANKIEILEVFEKAEL
ncbi:protein disulfide isomerase [Chloropicon primus]|uniref:protein disulfide-isomerase n=1 Tax=Chloropicon primus TaxID=1764295 RepID=A0A5B8MW05_9CHLO|nr:protein disulfide isomerase [Chloropicon primus]UPR03739.1 protein disulfide isomerase [Chloropicon primus]|eukprot:QDZ24531.1 protein disulfide isomerase [Chloropicon primus]